MIYPYQQLDINQIINNGNNLGRVNQAPQKNVTPANLGPNFYVPTDVKPNNTPVIPPRSSINSINDIDYYP